MAEVLKEKKETILGVEGKEKLGIKEASSIDDKEKDLEAEEKAKLRKEKKILNAKIYEY